MATTRKSQKVREFHYVSVTGEVTTIRTGENGVTAKWLRILEEDEHSIQVQDESQLKHTSFQYQNMVYRASIDPDCNCKDPLEQIPDPNSDPLEKLLEHDATCLTYELLANCIDQLTIQQQDLILKLYHEQKSMAEIAREEGVTHGAIRDRRRKLLTRLEKLLTSEPL